MHRGKTLQSSPVKNEKGCEHAPACWSARIILRHGWRAHYSRSLHMAHRFRGTQRNYPSGAALMEFADIAHRPWS
jgi:hypothetical protein